MIKFTATGDKGKWLFLGLSDRNVELLREGRPIKIDGAELGIDRSIMIFHGATEQAMVDQLIASGADIKGVPVHKHHDDDRQEGGEH